MDDNSDFWKRVRREAEPIISHAIVVLLLELALLVIGILTLALENLFPKHETYFLIIEKIDIYIALLLLCMFGIYTLLIVGFRLYNGLCKELYSHKQNRKGDEK